MRKVAIFQYRLLHYRTNFFDRLRTACADRDIQLSLICGQASRREMARKDEASLSWAHMNRNRFIEIGNRDIIWQPFPSKFKDADLVIVMQENRILSNYPLLLSRLWSRRKVAYWGHGKNFQSDAPEGIREQWKRYLLSRVDWWFAYTEATVAILREAGYAQDRITCLNNAIDNESFIKDMALVSEDEVLALRKKVGANASARIGIFCGSLYPDKRLDYMIAAVDIVRKKIPNFHLIVIGDGPSATEISAAARVRPWITYLGVLKGKEKAAYFSIADLVINPGAVGLHIIDAFCAGIPLVTTVDARHGPEIAYLRHEVDGMAVQGGVEVYADCVVNLLLNSEKYRSLCEESKKSSERYTEKIFVDNFASGIEKCVN